MSIFCALGRTSRRCIDSVLVHQVCTNANRCYCNPGFGGPDCSTQVAYATVTEMPTTTTTKFDLSSKMTQKETPYGKLIADWVQLRYGDGLETTPPGTSFTATRPRWKRGDSCLRQC